jgi:hypothetical protein
LRAGLLSDDEVINRLNKSFVCTSVIIDDVKRRAESGDELAKQLAAQWQYPLEMIFLTPACGLVSKLNSYQDFAGVHPDVVAPPKGQHTAVKDERSHVDDFLKHVARHFSEQ